MDRSLNLAFLHRGRAISATKVTDWQLRFLTRGPVYRSRPSFLSRIPDDPMRRSFCFRKPDRELRFPPYYPLTFTRIYTLRYIIHRAYFLRSHYTTYFLLFNFIPCDMFFSFLSSFPSSSSFFFLNVIQLHFFSFFERKDGVFFLTLSSFFFFFFIFFLYSLVYQPHRFKLCGKIRECLTVSTRPMQVIFRTLTQLAGLQATKTFSLLDVTESDKVYPTG